jgi:hypothetical protein
MANFLIKLDLLSKFQQQYDTTLIFIQILYPSKERGE